MKKNIINSMKTSMFMVAILIMGFPALSYASTYAYVNQSGQVNTVIADNPSMAIAIAPGISIHSGVALMSNTTGVVLGVNTFDTYSSRTYAYVNQDGTVVAISANSPTIAFANALGIDENSGVMLLSNTSGNDGVVGDNVSGM